MISNKLIAIDFGSTRISAMAAEVLENGALKIYTEESKTSDDVKWGIVEKPSGASFKVSELLKTLKSKVKMPDITHVSVSVGAKSMKHLSISISRFVGKPNVVSDDLLEDMLDECERKSQQPDITIFDIIPVIYLLDGKKMDDPVGHRANQITAIYNVILGNSIIKSELERCFDRTGIVLEYNPLAAEALSTVVFEDMEREVGCALINFGATTTTLAVYHDGALQHLLVVPLGAKNITKDIQELGINEANAERLKCLKGCALESMVDDPMYIQIASVEEGNPPVRISTKFLATIIEARLEEILQPVFDVIAKLPFKLEAGIVITGGGSKLKNITDFIAEKSGLYARFGDHSEWLSEDTNEKFHDPMYAQLIGTILLTNEYRKEHPIEETILKPEKAPKIKKNLGEKLSNRFFDFFNDDNKLN
ncbi:MAG: cell division protein FtsA [Bacteroidota bacterium]|nr:cell division protein FtsA [Bacteroidota bacterium]